MVAVSNDLGDDGGSGRWTTVGDNVGDDVSNDVGNRDDGNHNAGNNAGKGDGGMLLGREGWAPGRGRGGSSSGGGNGGSGNSGGSNGILLGLFPFYCEDNFVWYFYVWGEFAMSQFPHTLVMLEVCRGTFGWGR